MQTYDLEPMSLEKILSLTFRIYKDNFLKIIIIAAMIQIPMALLTTASRSVLPKNIQPQQDTVQNQENINAEESQTEVDNKNRDHSKAVLPIHLLNKFLNILRSTVIGFWVALGYALCRGALTKTVSELYIGHEITIGQTYKIIWPKLSTLIAAAFLTYMAMRLGLMLFIIPGIIFALWFALTIQVVIIEGLNATKAMSRSKALASGNLRKIFFVGLSVSVIVIAASISSMYIVNFLTKVLTPSNTIFTTCLNQLFYTVRSILITPIVIIPSILLYYDLRIRKEGFNLEMLENEMNCQ